MKERKKEYNKIYTQKPEVKEKLRNYKKEYERTPQRKEYKKNYDQKPEVKERENIRNSQIVVCECGCSLRRDTISRHKKTKTHMKLITQKEISN